MLDLCPRKGNYSLSILHKDSQFSVKGGDASCTYICLEMAQYFLEGLVSHDSADLLMLIHKVVVDGVKRDLHIGFVSCEQILPKVKHFSHLYSVSAVTMGKLRDDTVFRRLLDDLKNKAKGVQRLQCVILTKPPETIVLFHNGNLNVEYPFVIFEFVVVCCVFSTSILTVYHICCLSCSEPYLLFNILCIMSIV